MKFVFTLLFALSTAILVHANDVIDCRDKEDRGVFEKKAKKLAQDHCGSAAYKNLYISDAALRIQRDKVATHIISYDCGKKKYHAVLQLVPEDRCMDVQYQFIKADAIK
jgi:hypothetical protein